MTSYTICVFTRKYDRYSQQDHDDIYPETDQYRELNSFCETERRYIPLHDRSFAMSRDAVERVRQIRKIIEVLAVFGYLNEDIAYNEIALFKVSTPIGAKPLDIETINKVYKAWVVLLAPHLCDYPEDGHGRRDL